jgi:hypothetical protein
MSLSEPLPPTHPRLARATELTIGALLLGFFLAFFLGFQRFLAGSWRLVAAAFAGGRVLLFRRRGRAVGAPTNGRPAPVAAFGIGARRDAQWRDLRHN